MAGAPYRIVLRRSDGLFYYSRDTEHRASGISSTQPFFDEDARLARKFGTPAEAVARRDSFRQMWPRDRQRFFIESCSGGDPLFEERSAEVAPTDSTDSRTPLFIIPDDLLESRLGFLVRPGYTSSLGRCWCVRSCDVPSLLEDGRHETLETIYHKDPEWALYNARIAWGPAMKPFANPFPQVQAERQVQNEIHNPRRAGIRPGDRR
jgi:hypothetical protein